MLLSCAFCPPVEYLSAIAKESIVHIEAGEHYVKQTWRNRCRFLSAGGPEDFGVPVVHASDLFRTPVREVEVDYSTPWVERFEYALESAYGSSPFFEYYSDSFFGILDSRPRTLLELDLETTRWMCSKIGLAVQLEPTNEYSPKEEAERLYGRDLRLEFSPKRPYGGPAREYWQVWRGRYGFVGGLSALDLLFCEGPESICYL